MGNKKYIKIITLILCAFVILYFIDIKCLFKFFLGVSCPGCGLTRAYRSLVHLDFKQAFYYHPLFFVIPIIFFTYVKCPENNSLMSIFIVAFLSIYIYRLMDVNNDIVTINLEDGVIYKIFKYILKFNS